MKTLDTEQNHLLEKYQELEDSYQLLRLIVENYPALTFAKDSNFKAILLNNKFEPFLGKPVSELVNKTNDELFPPEYAKHFNEDDAKVMSLPDGEYLIYEEKYGDDTYLTIKYPVRFKDKTFICGAITKITDRVKAEKALQESEKKYKELNHIKDRLFSIIAHDLRSPFNGIIGFSEILHEKIEKKDYTNLKEYSDHILSASNKAFDLLNNLLEWARLQSGRIIFKPEYFSPETLVSDIINLFEDSFKNKQLNVSCNLEPGIIVYADKNMLHAIIRNLISNAVKFTNEKGNITIKAHNVNQKTNISVIDNGIGMTSDELKKLFRVDIVYSQKGTSDETGTGLGLMLCNEFLEKHNGKFIINTQPGVGSEFTIELPANSQPV